MSLRRIWTKLWGNSSYKLPELPIQLRDFKNHQNSLNTYFSVLDEYQTRPNNFNCVPFTEAFKGTLKGFKGRFKGP